MVLMLKYVICVPFVCSEQVATGKNLQNAQNASTGVIAIQGKQYDVFFTHFSLPKTITMWHGSP